LPTQTVFDLDIVEPQSVTQLIDIVPVPVAPDLLLNVIDEFVAETISS